MDDQPTQKKIKAIYRLLIELINGNLHYRIPFDGNDTQFNEIATIFNKAAEKMQLAEYLNPYIKYQKTISSSQDTAIGVIQKVQEYILDHLETPLPSTKELSEMFGTNEFTLKEHFRNLLKTSIYQFYNDERLKKAHNLIEQTAIPLKQISFLSGFNNYINFFKAFKKKYKYSPSDVKRIRT